MDSNLTKQDDVETCATMADLLGEPLPALDADVPRSTRFDRLLRESAAAAA